MGLFDFATDIFSDVSGSDLLDLGSSLVAGFSSPGYSTGQNIAYPVYTTGVPSTQPQVVPVAAPPMAAAAVAGVARWAMQFPSLWQAIQKFRAGRIHMTPEKLYSALKRFGPGVLTSMIGAAAVADLVAYKTTHKRRRMNVANTKALRRSLRRLKGFDTLAHRVKVQLSHSCHSRSRRKGGASYSAVSVKSR